MKETFDDELMSHVLGGGTNDFCPCLLGTKCECNVTAGKFVVPEKPIDSKPIVQA